MTPVVRFVVFALLVPALAMAAPGMFIKPYPIDAHGEGRGLKAGDFNADGKNDFLLIGPSTIRVLLGNDDLTFTLASTSVPSVTLDRGTAIGLVNNDAWLDVAIVDSSNRVVVYLGDGDGTFTHSATLLADSFTRNMVLADFTGDNKTDVFVRSGNLLFLFPGNGLGGFGGATTSNTSSSFFFYDAVSGDFDGDSDRDVAIAGANGLLIVYGDGSGSFSWPTQIGGPSVRTTIVAGDFNEDEHDDVASIHTASGVRTIEVYLQNPSTALMELAHQYAPVVESPLVTADMNGDTILDLITFDSVRLGNGDGSFADPALHHGVGTSGEMVVADYNGDDDPDVLTKYPFDVVPVLLTLGHGDGTLQANRKYVYGRGTVTLAEATGDAHLDALSLIVTDGQLRIATLPGNGDGTFDAPILTGTGTTTTTGLFADVNGDGEMDAVLKDGAVPDYVTWLGNGDGTFTAGGHSAINTTVSFELHDFTNDGRADMVRKSSISTITVHPATASGTFGSGINTSDPTPGQLFFGDVNNDGNLDILRSTVVLLGDGTGGFTTGPALTLGTSSEPGTGGIAGLVDLDEDGNLDLMSWRYVNTSPPFTIAVDVRDGNGNGTFGTPRTLYVEGAHFGTPIDIGDFDGDGNVDVSSFGLVLLGDGNGWFESAQILVMSAVTDIADLDGNGSSDIAFVGDVTESVGVGVLLTNTLESLEIPLDIELTSTPNPSFDGQTVMLTAELDGGSFLPSGVVSFLVDGVLRAVDRPTDSQTSTIGVPVGSGTHVLTALYPRDHVFATSSDTHQHQAVDKQSQTITLTANPPNAQTNGQTVTFTATVDPQTTGSITFKADGTAMAIRPITQGVATWSTNILPIGNYIITAEHPGDVMFQASTSAPMPYEISAAFGQSFPTTATAVNPTQVSVDWPTVNGATHYDVWRSTNYSQWSLIGTMNAPGPFVDNTVQANTVYFYRALAWQNGSETVGRIDFALTHVFTDDPLTPGTPIKAVHITELRDAVNALKAKIGQPAFSFEHPVTVGGPIRASHYQQLRTGLEQLQPYFTDANLTFYAGVGAGMPVMAWHFQQFRDALR